MEAVLIGDVVIVLVTLMFALRRHPRELGLVAIALVMSGIAAWLLWISSNDDDGLSGLVVLPMLVVLTLLTFPVALVNIHHARRREPRAERT